MSTPRTYERPSIYDIEGALERGEINQDTAASLRRLEAAMHWATYTDAQDPTSQRLRHLRSLVEANVAAAKAEREANPPKAPVPFLDLPTGTRGRAWLDNINGPWELHVEILRSKQTARDVRWQHVATLEGPNVFEARRILARLGWRFPHWSQWPNGSFRAEGFRRYLADHPMNDKRIAFIDRQAAS